MKVFTEEIFRSAADGDFTKLKAAAKADLHAHGLLSASYNKVVKIVPSVKEPPAHFNNFKEFIDYINFNYFGDVNISPYEFSLYEAALETMTEDGIVYTEMSFDLFSPFAAGISWEEYADKIKTLQHKFEGKIKLHPELGIHRATPVDFWKTEIPKALATDVFKSVDLYGDYNAGLVKDFTDAFDIARDAGLKIKYHSGELEEADRMEQDLAEYIPDAIQHGITSIKNPKVTEIIVEHNIMCNVCISSNLKLAGISRVEDHPVRKMFDAGIQISLGSDDLSVFGTTLSEDYFMLYNKGIFSVEELEFIRVKSILNF